MPDDAKRETAKQEALDRTNPQSIIERMAFRTGWDAASIYDKERLELLEGLLHELTDHEDAPCRLDHHGYCQEHNSFGGGECVIARARRVLGTDGTPKQPDKDDREWTLRWDHKQRRHYIYGPSDGRQMEGLVVVPKATYV